MNQETAKALIQKRLHSKRYDHVMGVAAEAVRLADHYGCDRNQAELAALFHDFCRNLSMTESDAYVKAYGLEPIYFSRPFMAHGKIAAIMLKREYGVTDEDVLSAIAFHTTGRCHMSLLEQIIYLADAIEPGRNHPGIEELQKMAYNDLDRACLMALERSICFVLNKGEFLHPDTLDARNDLLEKIKNRIERR